MMIQFLANFFSIGELENLEMVFVAIYERYKND